MTASGAGFHHRGPVFGGDVQGEAGRQVVEENHRLGVMAERPEIDITAVGILGPKPGEAVLDLSHPQLLSPGKSRRQELLGDPLGVPPLNREIEGIDARLLKPA